MTQHSDPLPFRITERFPLPDGRTGVSAWSSGDPEQLEQQLRTRDGHAHPEREPARRLHRSGPPLLTIEERRSGVLVRIDPVVEAESDPRWRTALLRSRRPDRLRRVIGPRDLPVTRPPADASRWTEGARPGEVSPSPLPRSSRRRSGG